jgi:hypothetical protein
MTVHARLMLSTLALCLFVDASGAQEQQKDVILSVTANTVRWAAVYKIQPERTDDPYFHVRVFEHRKGSEPWRFKELIFHMAVTPKALEASRIGRKAKTFNYKDVEIRGAYRRWLEDTSSRASVPVCETNILDCLKNFPG